MSTQSHTPGPWKVGGVNSRTIHAGKYWLADAENAADARLIALTPELLDFAEIVARSACLQQVNQGRCICFACEAQRLIAKAQGA